ncbi:MAG TPA: thioredoxin family protein [Lacipirellula sp.]
MILRSMAVIAFVLMMAAASAGEFNAKLTPGDKAPGWKDLPGVDGKRHALADLAKKKLVLVVFTCNSCDVASGYEDRIIDFAKRREDEVAVVAINVSTKPADALEFMRERAEEKKFPFPYLFDNSQKIGRTYGANYTPAFFLLDDERKIVYMGGMDDSTYADRVNHRYLDDAVEAVLAGRTPSPAETAPRGCRIRYRRLRRPVEKAKPATLLIDEHEIRERVRRNPPPTLDE